MTYFTDGNQTGQETQGNQADQTTEDWLSKVVQEKGERWQDPQELAKGYMNAQEYIKELERQTQELREDVGKKEYVEDLLKQLREQQAAPAGKPHEAQTNSGTSTEGNTSASVSEEQLKSLIEETLTRREQKSTAEQNLSKADQQLSELYGTEAAKVMQQKANELGMSKERLSEIAAESPTAFFRLIGEEVKTEANPVTKGTVNTAAGFTDSATSKKDWAYYQKLRRENPKQYYSPKVQNEMVTDRKRLGDKFFN